MTELSPQSEKLFAQSLICYGMVGFSLAVYLLALLLHISQPIAQDDLYYMVAAQTLHGNGVPLKFETGERFMYAPELYLRLLDQSFQLLGESEAVARLPGVVSGLLSISLVFLMTHSLAEGSRYTRLQWAAVAAALYALTPAVVQAGLILVDDTTILVPALLALAWGVAGYQREQRFLWAGLSAMAMAISLWMRVSTTPVIAVGLVLFVLVGAGSLGQRLKLVGAIGLGLALFVASWSWYCHWEGIQFSGPFTYAARAFEENVHRLTLAQVVQDATYFVLWVGVIPTVLFLVVFVRRIRTFVKVRELYPEDAFLIGGLILVLGFAFVGGAGFGYPRHQVPALPFLCIFGAVYLSRGHTELMIFQKKEALLGLLGMAVVACAAQVFLLGDPIYVVRYELRRILALGFSDVTGLVSEVTVRSLAFGFVLAGLAFTASKWYRLKLVGILYLCALGSSLGLSLLHGFANYQTGYNHGGRGTVEVAQVLREIVGREGVVIAPQEVAYYFGLPNAPYWPNSFWMDSQQVAKRLNDPATSAVVYSVVTNTVDQARMFAHADSIRSVLQREYDFRAVGTFSVWIRKTFPQHVGVELSGNPSRSSL